MKRYTIRVPQSQAKIKLDQFLAQWLPEVTGQEVPKSLIRSLIFNGSVYLNRHRTKEALTPIYPGAVLEVYFKENVNQRRPVVIQEPKVVGAKQVLYEDADIILVHKPSGMPTQPTIDPNRANLFDSVKRFLKSRENQEVYVGLHHRLDRDTSGVVLFTKSERANKGIADQFQERTIEKTYQCLCWRSAQFTQTDEEFSVDNFLARVTQKNENAKYGSVSSGGDRAITEFRVLESFRQALWLQAKPKTGRTHQIRVHCLELGAPILGDQTYFPAGVTPMVSAPRLMLHASVLKLKHPISGLALEISAPPPEAFLKVLQSLR